MTFPETEPVYHMPSAGLNASRLQAIRAILDSGIDNDAQILAIRSIVGNGNGAGPPVAAAQAAPSPTPERVIKPRKKYDGHSLYGYVRDWMEKHPDGCSNELPQIEQTMWKDLVDAGKINKKITPKQLRSQLNSNRNVYHLGLNEIWVMKKHLH